MPRKQAHYRLGSRIRVAAAPVGAAGPATLNVWNPADSGAALPAAAPGHAYFLRKLVVTQAAGQQLTLHGHVAANEVVLGPWSLPAGAGEFTWGPREMCFGIAAQPKYTVTGACSLDMWLDSEPM